MGVRQGFLIVLRDVASFLLGWTIIFKQAGIFFVPPAHPSELLIIMAALIIGVPGAAQLVAMRTGMPVTSPTDGPSSPSASSESSPSSSGA